MQQPLDLACMHMPFLQEHMHYESHDLFKGSIDIATGALMSAHDLDLYTAPVETGDH